jgi:hypothetical protein
MKDSSNSQSLGSEVPTAASSLVPNVVFCAVTSVSHMGGYCCFGGEMYLHRYFTFNEPFQLVNILFVLLFLRHYIIVLLI